MPSKDPAEPMETDDDPGDTSQNETHVQGPEQQRVNEEGHLEDEDGGVTIDGLYIPPPPPPALTFDNSGPRLIISNIECYDFKSYAGKQVLGPFHKSFTSIVGPNGSGKSNVIDSMLFVFGYRAQKIRSKKISVLIHDSEKHPNVRSCYVKVYFQEIIDDGTDPDNFEVVPNSQFVVSRTAFKDNSSYYEVDGRRCQFKEVSKLLRKKGVDLDHNRFLILQGEVEQIALMKPKAQNENETGMLEYLEDIVGSSRFKEPIEILKTRHSELDEHRTEKLNRVKLVEKEKDALEKPKDEAKNHLNALNTITRKTDVLYQLRIYTCESNAEKAKEKRKEFEKNSSELMEKLRAITEAREAKENEAKATSGTLEKLVREHEGIVDKIKQLELKHDSINEELKTNNIKRKQVMAMSLGEKNKYEKLKTLPIENGEKIKECDVLKERLELQMDEEKKKYEEALESLKAETQTFQDQKEKLETQLINLQKDENDKEAQHSVAKSELDLLKSTEQKEEMKLDQLKQKAVTSKNQLKEKEGKMNEYSKKIPELREQVSSSEVEMKKLDQDHEALSKTIQVMMSELAETKSKQSAIKSGNKVLESLLKQKSIGAIKGIYGRLGDLGAIDKKYDVAISTAAGSSLDRILVDNVDTANACVQYLKVNNVGRADLLALDKTSHYAKNLNLDFQTPENAPRLIDLIQVKDQAVKTAFYRYVNDTLVAVDMKQATRIAYGARRFRVVTLDGELIETSGAMSGGGREKMRGKMGTQVVASVNTVDLRKIETTLAEEEKKYNDVNEKKSKVEYTLSLAKRELAEKTRTFEKLKLETSTLREERNMLKEQIMTQQKLVDASHPDEAKVAEMEAKVEKLLKQYEASSENSRELKEGVQKLNKKIKEIQASKVKSVKSKLESVTCQLDKVKKEITRLKVDIKSSTRNLEKSKDKYETYDQEIKEIQKTMLELNETRDNLTRQSSELKESIGSTTLEIKTHEQILKEFKDELKKMEGKENSYKSERIEFDQVLDQYKEDISKNTKLSQHWKRERQRLKLEEIPGEDEQEDLQVLTLEELDQVNHDELDNEIAVLTEAVKDKRPDLNAIQEYRMKEAVYMERVTELDIITKSRDEKKKLLEELKKKRLENFMEGFSIITSKLKEMYQMITYGGDAELELVDTLDPFTEGIVFSVRPPKKSWKNISNLSGGEKTLSSLALVFALHYYKPTPLYVMDEIDAALDFKNVSIVANYIKDRTKNAQFIIISLRSNMFELADRLVGIYKTNNATKSVTINPKKIVQEE